ncbi:MAG: ATP-grasp domain-containing protein, partial [Gammaproteobacteria bacterium]|nr:ATP-grasp domain-containing protein [Gammaproteobacteria bacterium]
GTDDTTIELASHAASQLALPHNPASATRLTQRKDLAREFLSDAGANIPWHKKLHIHDDVSSHDDIIYPVVLKPLNLSASRGVIRANNATELEQAIKKIIPSILDTYDAEAKEFVLVEQYIQGVEIALEGLLNDNDLTTLAIFDKPDPLDGPYFEETYYITPSRLPMQTLLACQQAVLKCCQSLGLTTGPIHAELRIDDNDKPWILEVAARTIGGDCGQSLKPSSEYSLEELVISYAINEPIKPEPQQHSSGVLMIPVPQAGILKRVEGLTEARKTPNITSLTIDIPAGNEVQCLPESSSYLGFIFAEAETPEETELALRNAHQQLKFVIHPVWKIDNNN